MGEVGNLLTGVVAQLKDFDTEEDKGFFGLFKKSGDKLSNLKQSTIRRKSISQRSVMPWRVIR